MGEPRGLYTKAAREARLSFERLGLDTSKLNRELRSLRGRLAGGGRGRRGEWEAAIATALKAHCEGMELELAEEHLRNSDDDQQNGGEVFPMSDEEDSQTSSSSSDESDNERPAEEDRQTSSSSSATQAAEDPCAGYPMLGGGGNDPLPARTHVSGTRSHHCSERALVH